MVIHKHMTAGGSLQSYVRPLEYEVIDRQTGQTIGKPCKSLAAASRKVDRLHDEYSSNRYFYRVIPHKL